MKATPLLAAIALVLLMAVLLIPALHGSDMASRDTSTTPGCEGDRQITASMSIGGTSPQTFADRITLPVSVVSGYVAIGTSTVTFELAGWSGDVLDIAGNPIGLGPGTYSMNVSLAISDTAITTNNMTITVNYDATFYVSGIPTSTVPSSATKVLQVKVPTTNTKPKPVISLGSSSDTFNLGDTIPFDGSLSKDDDTGDAITQYEWDLGDGSAKKADATFEYKYASVGEYTVTLKVWDKASNTNVTNRVVKIRDPSSSGDGSSDSEKPPFGFIPQVVWDNKEIISGVGGGLITLGGILFAFLRKKKKHKLTDKYQKEIEAADDFECLDRIKERISKDLIGEKIDEREYIVLEKKLNDRAAKIKDQKPFQPYNQQVQEQATGQPMAQPSDYYQYQQPPPGQPYPGQGPPTQAPPAQYPQNQGQPGHQQPGYQQPPGQPPHNQQQFHGQQGGYQQPGQQQQPSGAPGQYPPPPGQHPPQQRPGQPYSPYNNQGPPY